jgi:hypothetical protein
VDVLKRFGMMDCKSMSTLMITNLRKLHDSNTGSNLGHIFVGPTYFRDHMILGGFSAHGFLPMVFYFRLRN